MGAKKEIRAGMIQIKLWGFSTHLYSTLSAPQSLLYDYDPVNAKSDVPADDFVDRRMLNECRRSTLRRHFSVNMDRIRPKC